MESLSAWQKAALVFGGGFILAAGIGAIANIANLGRDGTYLLAAAAIALVAGLGVPWTLGWSRPILFEGRDKVQAHETAVIADPSKYWVALAYDETFLVAHRLQQHGRASKSPVIYPASGAITIRLTPVEGVGKSVKVVDLHRYDPTTFAARRLSSPSARAHSAAMASAKS